VAKKKAKAKSIAEQAEDARWENYNRRMVADAESDAEAAHHPQPLELKTQPVKNRSSFAWARQHRVVSKAVETNFASNDVNYLPAGMSGFYDVQPVLSVKNLTGYIVIKRTGKREVLLARGFTTCCRDDKHCKRKRCAKCFVLEQKQTKGTEYLVREVMSNEAPKVVDPFGVDPTGRRGQSKDLDPKVRATFRLTSSQSHYKAGAANWNE